MAIPTLEDLTSIASLEDLKAWLESYKVTVPHMEWGNFATPDTQVYRVSFKTAFLKAPSVICVGSARTGTLTAPTYTAPKITLPAVPKFASITLPSLPTFATVTLPTLPTFGTISLPTYEIPRVSSPNLANTLANTFKDTANSLIPDWFTYLGIPLTSLNLKSAMVVVFGIIGGLVGNSIDKFWNTNFQTQLDNIRNKLNEAMSTIRNNIQSTINSFSSNLNTGIATLRNNLQSTINVYSSNLNTGLATIRNNIQSTIDAYSNNVNTLIANYNTSLQASINSVNAQVQDSINKSLSALYTMLGIPAGMLVTPVSLNDVTNTYFDIVGVPNGKFWWFAIEEV